MARELSPRACPSVDGHRVRQHRGVPRRVMHRDRAVTGLVPGARVVPQRRDRARRPARHPARSVAQHPRPRGHRRTRGRRRVADRGTAHAARTDLLPRARARGGVHRLLPRHAVDHPALHRRLRPARTAVARHPRPAGGPRHHRAGADLLGLRVRGLPRRHRLGAPEPARRRAVAGPDLRPDDAPRRSSSGGTSRGAAAAQRLRRAAEGRRADLGARAPTTRCARRRSTPTRRSTSRPTSSPACCSWPSRSRRSG